MSKTIGEHLMDAGLPPSSVIRMATDAFVDGSIDVAEFERRIEPAIARESASALRRTRPS